MPLPAPWHRLRCQTTHIFSSPESPAASDDLAKDWIVDQIDLLTLCNTALRPFTLLRKVSRVENHGVVKPPYKQYLIETMQGSSPLDHLSRMYDALQHYAGHIDCVEGELQKACKAIESDDERDFKRVRAAVVEKVEAYMAETKQKLYESDARLD